MSRIGKLPIDVPAGVTITVDSDVLTVKRPKGELTVPHLSDVTVTVEGTVARVARNNDERIAKAQHGLQRALLFNAVEGVTKGYEKKLEVNGVGFRVDQRAHQTMLTAGWFTVIFWIDSENAVLDLDSDSWRDELLQFTFGTFDSHIARVNRDCHTGRNLDW
jgi:hypothetical protein